jgi:pyridoxal phosphate enzyme (YggS family)
VIAERVLAVRDRIARAAGRAGRKPSEITLVAVSKTHGPEVVREAALAGIRDFGENRVQEAEGKIAALGDLGALGVRWHLVGHLQANKARKALSLFGRIHSLDSVELGARLERIAAETQISVPVLVEVELGGEETKHGLKAEDLLPFLEACRSFTSLRLDGLMCIPPPDADPIRTHGYFASLRELRDRAVARGLLQGGELSMGMSHDFEIAIEEGATQVRIGTALFGDRTPAA